MVLLVAPGCNRLMLALGFLSWILGWMGEFATAAIAQGAMCGLMRALGQCCLGQRGRDLPSFRGSCLSQLDWLDI